MLCMTVLSKAFLTWSCCNTQVKVARLISQAEVVVYDDLGAQVGPAAQVTALLLALLCLAARLH